MLECFTSAWRCAIGDSAGGIRRASVPATVRWNLTGRRSAGWYARLGHDLVGFGLSGDELTLWIGLRRWPAEQVTVALRDAGGLTELRVGHAGAEAAALSYPRVRLPAIAAVDPIFDETREDRDFGFWLGRTLADPARMAHLGRELAC